MILCDFEDLNKEQFHLQFFNAIVHGHMNVILEILQHPKLSKQFDISYNNYYCIIASILNAKQVDDCHFDFLKLFTQSPLLKKHANPSLCSCDDIFSGSLGNAIIFTPIETVRFIGKFFHDKVSNLQDLLALAIFNNKKEAFFYLVKERQFIIQKPEVFIKALVNFPHIDSDIVHYVHHCLMLKNNVITPAITLGVQHPQQLITIKKSSHSYKKNFTQSFSKKKLEPKLLGKTLLLNVSQFTRIDSTPSWGSKFRKKF